MKLLCMLIIIGVSSVVHAEEWTRYFSSDLVEAYYDKETKRDSTLVVKWVYTKKSPAVPDPVAILSRFKAYCSTRQLFDISEKNTMREVDLVPETLFEATWKIICGEH